MNQEQFVILLADMTRMLDRINDLKNVPFDQFDTRSVAIAATNFETAMLWVANARK